jgi:16S rRNA (adenine1518-N6/adenine1519-N6)-dimethyltransferase
MKPKKSLGQNFLKDKEALKQIIKAADLKSSDFVIEIGPGEGILTKELAKHARKVVAIEIDNNLAKKLDSRFRGNDRVEIIHGDILKINLPELVETHCNASLQSGYKLIANIPYYITSPIIQLFLETKYPPCEMILMVQKEVAERICAQPGDMSILAVSVQYYARPELLFYVNRKSFWPVPEVDSAVIRIAPFPSPIPSTGHFLPKGKKDVERKDFFRIVKAGFSAKRKMLANNLANSFHLDKKIVEEKLKKVPLDKKARAQELTLDNWKKLADILKTA